MKKSFTYLSFLALPLLGYAQEKGLEPIIEKGTNGTITSVRFSSSGMNETRSIAASAAKFFKEYLETTPADEFEKVPHASKDKEFIHEHYDQYCKGVKVEGGGYNFHYKNGKMYFAHGHYVKIMDLNTKPDISPERARDLFAQYKMIPADSITDFISNLIVKEIPDDKGNEASVMPKLVYRIYLYAKDQSNTEVGFVDAHTGKVLMTEPAVTDLALVPATGTFETRYSGQRQGITENISGTFHLEDLTRGATIHTWNLQNTTNTANRVELLDNDNNWTAAEHSGNNNDMGLDVHWALQRIYDRLFNAHGINSFDDAGFPIDAHIRYGTFDEERDNASWDLVNNELRFGDGAVVFSPVASIDAVAHEFGHGITDFQIGWPYTDDRAAFHEGLSDIWGVIMEHRILPNNIWHIGEQITLTHPTLRNIQNTNDPNALAPISDTYLSTQYNSGNQYVRSGVLSHWFYIIAVGESGTNDVGNSYNVVGISIDQAENLIVHAVSNNYLDLTTTYPEIRTSMIQAATDLFGANSCQVIAATNAWYAVGVGDPFPTLSISGPDLVCTSGQFTVNNVPPGATITWTQSSNLNYVSGQGTTTYTVSKASDGSAWIEASISGCGNPVHKDIQAGRFSAMQISLSGQQAVCPNEYYTYTANVPGGHQPIYTYAWAYPSGWSFESQGENRATFFTGSGGEGQLRCSVNNSCGPSEYAAMSVFTRTCGFSLAYYPNPAEDELTVSFTRSSESESPYDVRIYDGQANLMYSTTSNQETITVPASTFPEGRYILNIIHKEGIIQRQIFISR